MQQTTETKYADITSDYTHQNLSRNHNHVLLKFVYINLCNKELQQLIDHLIRCKQ